MKPALAVYNELKKKVTFLYDKLKLFRYKNSVGRTLALPIIETLTLALYKQTQNIATKKAIWKDFQPNCSYKTLVVNMNRCAVLALLVLMVILRLNRLKAHIVKHTDATDIPVCLKKNAKFHKTMYGLAEWGNSGKGSYYGLKLHITTDLNRRILSIRFSTATADDRQIFLQLNSELLGLFVTDAGYVALITASATLVLFSLPSGTPWWTEGSRRYLNGCPNRGTP